MSFEQKISKWHNDMDILTALKGIAIYPSPPDTRDYTIDVISAPILPDKVSLPSSPIILDQGATPFCGGASGAGIANGFFNNINQMPKKGFSMTFLYWLAKMYDGIPNAPGTYLRTILKVMNKYGCAPENLQPFSTENNPTLNQDAFKVAENYKVKSYYKVSTVYEMKVALAGGMYLLMATFLTRDNWRSGNGGWISVPSGEFAGGHATNSDGYDNHLRSNVHNHIGYFLCSNSWGESWGDGGRHYLPFDYLNFKLKEIDRYKFIEAWAVEFDASPFSVIEDNQEKEEVPNHVLPRGKRFRRLR